MSEGLKKIVETMIANESLVLGVRNVTPEEPEYKIGDEPRNSYVYDWEAGSSSVKLVDDPADAEMYDYTCTTDTKITDYIFEEDVEGAIESIEAKIEDNRREYFGNDQILVLGYCADDAAEDDEDELDITDGEVVAIIKDGKMEL